MMQTQRQTRRQTRRGWRMMVGAALVTVMTVMSGCSFLPRNEEGSSAASAYAAILPAGWSILGDVRAVNLNGAAADADLVLFQFDFGLVGAMIFEDGAAVALDAADWLLPRHFGDANGFGQGFIAPPGTAADEVRVDVLEVNPSAGGSPGREMVMRGGSNHLTFVWWDAELSTYGVSQLVAPGGFGGVDWEAWEKSPEVIETLSALLPLSDYRARSQICQEMVYVRQMDLSGVVFDERPQGLRFCADEFPPHPYYAEGVVLAYLLWPRPDNDNLIGLLTPGVTLPQLDAQMVYDRLAVERIEDISAHVTLPLAPADTAVSATSVTTPVCVELVEQANPDLRRWVVFTLRYQPADPVAALPARWTLSSARTEPPPPTSPEEGYCTTILARSAP